MGVELENPIVDERARINNFTNEGGVGGTIRFLKNIMGLWLVQECRRVWAREGSSYSYEQLARMALDSPACASLIDPDAPEFWLPPRMPAAIGEFCRRTGQNVPTEPGPVVRCALDSLALRYRWVLDRLEECTGRKLEVIHVVGGGSQNALLCQLTADACNRPVLTGPVEATAMGNVLVQAIGLGLIGSLAQAREIVRRSVQLTRYEPQQPKEWLEPYERFRKLDTDG
jgi:rhamnulokinase